MGLFTVFSVKYGYSYFSGIRGNKNDTDGDRSEDVMGAHSCENFPEKSEDLIINYEVSRDWVLLGDEFNSDEKTAEIRLELNENYKEFFEDEDNFSISYVVKKIEDNTFGTNELKPEFGSTVKFYAELDATDYSPGEYIIGVSIDHSCGEINYGEEKLNISYPVYVAWTFDWEGYEVKREYLDDVDELTLKHYDIPITHFYNPRIYSNSMFSQDERDFYTNWITHRRDEHGHAIGLHLHMFPDMVKAAGVNPHSEPAWGWNTNDGYDILVSGYSYQDMSKILTWAKGIFVSNGLGEPVMFRAGGWFADEGTLKVLQDNGFVLDSSGRLKYVFGRNQVTGHWDLKTTTQPYHPNYYNQNSAADPVMDIWEFPNNGGDSWSLSKDEMKQRFVDNYSGGVLTEKKLVNYLSHPEWFYEDKPKMDQLLGDLDKLLYEDDLGPVVYITLDEAYKIWN
ncbi:hypothetical protein JW710_00590 [Candidatus Dojkabacteria bacterium]|nr:hypothetical protein [Candidatus Dojkabacteria bacterium]